ncbi:long-chain fatty acid--CoA ligase [Thermodesulfobacteriota bacterium]
MNIAGWIRQRASLDPGAPAITDGELALDNGGFYHRMLSASVFLRSLGIKTGDRVAVLLYNSSLFLELFFGCAHLGAICVPLNYRLVGAELDYMIENSGSSLLISDPDFEESLKSVGLDKASILEPDRKTGKLYTTLDESEVADKARWRETEVGAETPLMILYTSGTTGRPKGATLSHGNILWNAIMHIHEGLLRERALLNAPLFHVGGINAIATQVLHGNGSLVIQRTFDPHEALELMEKEKITCMFGAPAMLDMMSRDPLFATTDFSNLRYLMVGSAPIPLKLIEKYHNKGIKIRQGYGLTEASPAACLLHDEYAMVKPGSCGREFFHLEIRIVDDAGRELPRGDVGELTIRGPNVMLGYWRDPKATEETLRDGWLRTGDLARKDEEGFIYIVDRKKDLIISGGENIYPAEIEMILAQHKDVVEVAVIGVLDEKWGEVPKAYIIPEVDRKPEPPELIAFCSSRMAKYKIPKTFEFVEDLPRTGVGKVNKKVLRQKKS